jgi:DNA-3-methyladenine glycosylase
MGMMTDLKEITGYRIPDRGFFSAGALELAPLLLGCLLVRSTTEGMIAGSIIETEAYHESERSCHAFGGRTRRNWPMFESGGLAYVYMIYGIHFCFNVCSGVAGTGEAVLVRALRPERGVILMTRNRSRDDTETLCSGPGNLCRALGIDASMNGADLRTSPLRLLVPVEKQAPSFERTRRVGITKARGLDWRFVAKPLEQD